VTAVYSAISRAALIVAVLLAGATFVFSYLAYTSTETARCAGRAVVEGHRSGISDFLALPLLSVPAILLVLAFMRSNRVNEAFATYDVPVLELASIRITLGMLVIYVSLFGVLLFLGVMTGFSAVRYGEIANYCRSAATS